jgi:hypothetical protein
MRVFVFLLILANLLFFAWTRGYLGAGEPDAPRASGELRAGQIRIVSNSQPPEGRRASVAGAPEPAPIVSPPREDSCFALSDISQTEADSLERLFAEKLPAFKLSRMAAPGNPGYWVHIPSLKTRREAENKVEELKRLGIREYFIMQESGDSFAVSLGLFSTPGAAESTLAALRDRGVRQARMIERPRRLMLSRIEILGPESQAREMQQALDQVLSPAQAKPGVCERSAAR